MGGGGGGSHRENIDCVASFFLNSRADYKDNMEKKKSNKSDNLFCFCHLYC